MMLYYKVSKLYLSVHKTGKCFPYCEQHSEKKNGSEKNQQNDCEKMMKKVFFFRSFVIYNWNRALFLFVHNVSVSNRKKVGK
jgi:hypothetical protein